MQLQHEETPDLPVEHVARQLDLSALEAWLTNQQQALAKLIEVHKADMADCEVLKVVLSDTQGQKRGFS